MENKEIADGTKEAFKLLLTKAKERAAERDPSPLGKNPLTSSISISDLEVIIEKLISKVRDTGFEPQN